MRIMAYPYVKIVGDHPHEGCRGRMTGEVDTVGGSLGPELWKVELDTCPHGVDACFAEMRNLRRCRETARRLEGR